MIDEGQWLYYNDIQEKIDEERRERLLKRIEEIRSAREAQNIQKVSMLMKLL